jgi:hypothetical protein
MRSAEPHLRLQLQPRAYVNSTTWTTARPRPLNHLCQDFEPQRDIPAPANGRPLACTRICGLLSTSFRANLGVVFEQSSSQTGMKDGDEELWWMRHASCC